MSSYNLSNLSVFNGEDTLFLNRGDHYLIKIQGDDRKNIESVITALKNNPSLTDVYEETKHQLENDHDYFQQIIDWLKTNGIIQQERSSEPVQKNLTIYGQSFSEESLFLLKNALSDNHYQFKIKEIVQPNQNPQCDLNTDMVLLFSPLFYNNDHINTFISYTYEHKIPVLHIGIDEQSFILGPISDPKHQHPCIACYSKRKLSNMAEIEDYLSFSKIPEKEIVHLHDMGNFSHFNVFLSHLEHELKKLFRTDFQYSPLFNKSIEYHLFSHEIKKSRVLRLPHCTICNPQTHSHPYNG